ncbi:MAG: T9SS type A sorting domain-containing protein [Mariniphaga sp.]|nr:T9SS type A sorting domain-containing protein [Mariniphaga sp.]
MKNFTLRLFIMASVLISAGLSYGQDVVDLSGSDNPLILLDTLPDVADGTVILLGPGKTYSLGTEAYALDKSIEFRSSDPTASELPKWDCSKEFTMADGATVGSVVFKNISFSGDFDGNYVFNINVAATVGEIKFESCEIRSLRGITRMKDNGPGELDKYTIIDCVIDSIRDYALLTVDKNTWICNDILIKNSTISRTQQFLQSRNNSNSVVIENCTLNETPKTGKQIFRWRESGQDNVLNGITLKNVIWSHGWDMDATGGVGVDGFDGLGETSWTIENCYATSEFNTEGKDTIVGFPNVAYSGTADELWVDRANGDYNFLDMAFAGKSDAGDPRWAVEAPVETGTVWNISSAEFNALGEIAETVTVNGLTIYAHSGKKVTIDENNKSLDGMDFTHRLKLGGSGDFDEAGMPLGRVLAFDVEGDSKITVMGMSSSSSSDRVLNIAVGHKDSLLAEFPALGASISKGEYTYTGGPTTIYMYSPSSGVNMYYIKVEDAPAPDWQAWNISSDAFNALGELTETVKVEGLTIYAHSGKKVTIDENNKSLDGMDFTHRLKLGGSGDFDEAGMPLGRVLTFKVNGDSKITVMGMSSSSSSDRVLNIATGDKDNLLAEFPALGASISKGEYMYTGGPTTIYMYSPSSGVNLYYIKAEKLNTSVIDFKVPELVVFPNPATDRVFVRVTEPTDIAIYNLSGNVMVQKTVTSSQESINISELSSGLYIVRSMNNPGMVKKLIVQ